MFRSLGVFFSVFAIFGTENVVALVCFALTSGLPGSSVTGGPDVIRVVQMLRMQKT